MARSSECTEQYAQKVLDTADIVRDAIYQQSTHDPVKAAGGKSYFTQPFERRNITTRKAIKRSGIRDRNRISSWPIAPCVLAEASGRLATCQRLYA